MEGYCQGYSPGHRVVEGCAHSEDEEEENGDQVSFSSGNTPHTRFPQSLRPLCAEGMRSAARQPGYYMGSWRREKETEASK